VNLNKNKRQKRVRVLFKLNEKDTKAGIIKIRPTLEDLKDKGKILTFHSLLAFYIPHFHYIKLNPVYSLHILVPIK